MRYFNKVALVTGFILSTQVFAGGFSQCADTFPSNYQQRAPSENRELCFNGFAVLYSPVTKTPVFAVEHLTAQRIIAAKDEPRTDHFYEEARLPSRERSTLDDYKGSGFDISTGQIASKKFTSKSNWMGFDRGHTAPAGDMAGEESMAQSFSLANMVPQVAEHNRGVWRKIETDTRKYISRSRGDVYVFTGPWFDKSRAPRTIGNNVRVPDVIWKVVFNATTREAYAHWSLNAVDQSIQKPISYMEFERRTGLNLLR